MKRWMSVAGATVALAALTGPCRAGPSESVELPVVKDQDVLDGYGTSKADIIGIRFGEKRADAIRILKEAYPEARMDEDTFDMRIGDSRGNRLVWKYEHRVRASASDEESSSGFTLKFTSNLSGGRAYQIVRTTDYPADKPADMATIRAAIAGKYGEPTIVERYDHQGRIQITYTWEKRPIKRFGDYDVRANLTNYSAPRPDQSNPCLLAVSSTAYSSSSSDIYSPMAPGTRAGNPGWNVCIGGIKFTIYFGANAETVSRVETIATDYERSMRDARLLDATLEKMLTDKANSVRGNQAPPKL